MNQNTITLYTETFIDSCHRLESYDGKCCNLHGHTWKVSVWIQGDDDQKDDVGILFDFGKVKEIKEELDHKYINDFFPKTGLLKNDNPTAENICKHILLKLANDNEKLAFRVRVYETAVGKETYCQRQTQNFEGVV